MTILQAMRRMDTEYKEEKQRGTPGIVDVEELSLEFMKLDTSSFQSTKEFVEAYKKSERPLHVLICNAGVSKAKPGVYMTFTETIQLLSVRPSKLLLVCLCIFFCLLDHVSFALPTMKFLSVRPYNSYFRNHATFACWTMLLLFLLSCNF